MHQNLIQINLQFPRWHTYARVINDLTTYGRVITNRELLGRDGGKNIPQTDPDHEAEIQKNERAVALIAGLCR